MNVILCLFCVPHIQWADLLFLFSFLTLASTIAAYLIVWSLFATQQLSKYTYIWYVFVCVHFSISTFSSRFRPNYPGKIIVVRISIFSLASFSFARRWKYNYWGASTTLTFSLSIQTQMFTYIHWNIISFGSVVMTPILSFQKSRILVNE